MTQYREILRLDSLGFSQRSIAGSVQCSRNTVAEVVRRAKQQQLSWPLPLDLTETNLERLLFPDKAKASSRKDPDYEYVHKELARNGVTLSLLWSEYCEECSASGEIPFQYAQYCKGYSRFAKTSKATMHIHRKPGAQMEVDWAGQTASITDSITGENYDAYIFVAVLPSSQYAYVEAFLTQNQESWITAHVNAFSFFDGVATAVIPDNLKTGVEKANWYSPVINKSYHEMAEHYGTAIVPSRVRKPKDKPSVEGTVGVISTWIIASLRNQKYFSVGELNEAISKKLKMFNERPFQKKPGSRYSVFLDEEKETLQPLPTTPYELALWKKAIVQYNYHLDVDKMHYSVPYEYIKCQVDIRITHKVVEVFYNGLRVCSHPRLYGHPGRYATITQHMPESHQKYMEWNGERFISWAESVGENTVIVIKGILASHKVEQQGYRSCMGILKLADKYSTTRLEAACKRALGYTPSPSYKNITSILQTGQDKRPDNKSNVVASKESDSKQYGFTRGAQYYGGKE